MTFQISQFLWVRHGHGLEGSSPSGSCTGCDGVIGSTHLQTCNRGSAEAGSTSKFTGGCSQGSVPPGLLEWGPQPLTGCCPEATRRPLLCGPLQRGDFFIKAGERECVPGRWKLQSCNPNIEQVSRPSLRPGQGWHQGVSTRRWELLWAVLKVSLPWGPWTLRSGFLWVLLPGFLALCFLLSDNTAHFHPVIPLVANTRALFHSLPPSAPPGFSSLSEVHQGDPHHSPSLGGSALGPQSGPHDHTAVTYPTVYNFISNLLALARPNTYQTHWDLGRGSFHYREFGTGSICRTEKWGPDREDQWKRLVSVHCYGAFAERTVSHKLSDKWW